MPRALRNTKTGEMWPMNPELARHEDIESVLLDKDGKIIGDDPAPAEAPEAPAAASATDSAEATKKTTKKSSVVKTKQHDAE